jgi:hypothetical protein
VHDAGSLVGDGSGGLWGSVAGPPASTMLAGQTGFLGLGLGQGVGDWVDHRGPVKPERSPVIDPSSASAVTRAACATMTRAPTAGATVA